VNILCVAGSRGERARLSPVIAHLQGDHDVVSAFISRAGEVPTWDAGAPPPAPLALEMSDAAPAARVGAALRWIEPLLEERRPALLLTCGDSDAAVGAALAASFAGVAIAHLDAGVVVDPANPNGRLLDQAATFLLAPHLAAVERLAALGMEDSALQCGDVLADAAEMAQGLSPNGDCPLPGGYSPRRDSPRPAGTYCLCYLGGGALGSPALPALFPALARIGLPVLMPAAARARARLEAAAPGAATGVRIVAPLDYGAMQRAIAGAAFVITDSPTVQREAYFRGTVALGLAPADFPDGERSGWVRRVELDEQSMVEAAQAPPPAMPPQIEAQRGASLRAAQFLTGL